MTASNRPTPEKSPAGSVTITESKHFSRMYGKHYSSSISQAFSCQASTLQQHSQGHTRRFKIVDCSELPLCSLYLRDEKDLSVQEVGSDRKLWQFGVWQKACLESAYSVSMGGPC